VKTLLWIVAIGLGLWYIVSKYTVPSSGSSSTSSGGGGGGIGDVFTGLSGFINGIFGGGSGSPVSIVGGTQPIVNQGGGIAPHPLPPTRIFPHTVSPSTINVRVSPGTFTPASPISAPSIPTRIKYYSLPAQPSAQQVSAPSGPSTQQVSVASKFGITLR
jgi:hypothetical protein